MKTRANCPKCGTPLSEHSHGEFCPRCALLGAISLGDQPQTDLEAESPHPTAERDLDDYELLEEIGRGGMGVVFKARQKSLNRIVAVKMLLHGRFADPAFRRRFRLEAEAAAHLEHPNIVPIHEIGERAGQPFFSMGWVDGHSLDRELTDGPLPPERCAHLVATLAHAVHHAHQHGILHRDLKPHNVIIDAEGEPHLTDFGLAKLLENDAGLTLTETILGSPGFVSPEQAAGLNANVTTASDVFSLGAVLYMMLTGAPPFPGESTIATLHQVIACEPTGLRVLVPSLPRDLETICLKCLQKEPERRYGSAEALATDLERWMRNEPIRARPVHDLERFGLWCRRRPWRAGLSTALIAAVFTGGIGITSQWRRAEEASRRAEAGQLAAEQEAYAARISSAQSLIRLGQLNQARQTLLEAGPESLRGWEWGWLMRECNQDLMTLGREGGGQNDAAFSPDGRFLITGGEDGAIRIHDLQSDAPPQVLEGGHTSAVQFLTLSRDGKTAITTHRKQAAKIWDLEKKTISGSIEEVGGSITRVAIHPDGKAFVTGTSDGKIRWRELGSGKWVRDVAHYDDGAVLALAFSPDGSQLAWGGGLDDSDEAQTTHLCILDIDTHKLRILPGHTAAIKDLAFSPDGKWLATVGATDAVMVTRPRGNDSLRVVQTLPQGSSYAALAFSPDSKQLMTAGSGRGVGLRNVIVLPAGSVSALQVPFDPPIRSVAYSPDGRLFATAAADGTVQLWPSQPHSRYLNLEGHNQDVWAVAVSPDGRYVASGSLDHTAKIWEMRTGRLLRTIQVHAPVVSLAFTADSRNLITNAPENSAMVWSVNQPDEILTLHGHEGLVLAVAADPTGRWFATGSRDRTVRIWDATTGDELRLLSETVGYVTSVAFSPDGDRLAAGGILGKTAIWETVGGRLICQMEGHERVVNSLHFSPDGKRLATGAFDGTARIWNTDTGIAVGHPLQSLHGGMMGLALAPDGNRLLTTQTRGFISRIHHQNRSITLWDVATGRRLWQWNPHPAGTYSTAFSPDGTRLITGGGDNTARIWSVFPWKTEDYPGADDTSPESRLEQFKRTFWSEVIVQTPSDDRQLVSRPWGQENLPKRIPLKTEPERPIPPRAPEAGTGQIDLSPIYNAALNEVWQPVVTYFGLDADLAALQPGRYEIGGIPFDLRGVIQLGTEVEDWTVFPRSADIPIHRTIHRFHVVHAITYYPPKEGDGTVVGAYRLHFEDGEIALQPIIYGTHLRSFWKEGDMVDECEDAILAWQWKEPARREISKYHRLFMATFENPRPEVVVTHIEYVSGDTIAAPFLVGMTVE